ncbi:uncharacterized protein [Ptychodera flava]|uniref:uncharacterized protein n=1 Tax=Ptychodera flava TaxID=63121 RepID=UPI00396A4553
MYLHRQSPQIIHLDVKPSNILLDSSFNARLADVGFIKDYDLSRAALSLPGTPGYQDISMLEEWPFRPTNDLFSLGVVMLQMLTGMPAIIKERDRRQCLHAYLRNKGCFKTKGKLLEFVLKDVWPSSSGDKELTSSFAKLVDQCLQPFPEERISMDQLHESMKNLVNKSGCEMYNEPKDEMLKDLCVACHLNEKVNDFPLLSKECSDMCNVVCVQCLIDSPKNELVCPRHGAAQPPIGHSESYAMFIGINIKAEDNFREDAKQMHKVFTDPKIGAIREQNAILMTSCKSDHVNDRLIPTAENILHQLSCLKEKMEGKDEVSFLFYFSGHGSENGSSVKCSKGQNLEASQLRLAIHDMNFTQLLIIMDCCYAAKVGPLSPPLLKSFTEGYDDDDTKDSKHESELEEMGIPNLLKAEITIDDKTLNQNESKKSPSRQSPNYSAVQWSASKCDQTSIGYQTGLSLFTSHIIAGLRASGDCQLRATKTHPQSTNQCDKCCSHKQKMQRQSYVTFNELSKYVFCHVRQQLQRHHEQFDQTPHTVAEENIRYNRKMAYCIS